jgi:hypothetical protein
MNLTSSFECFFGEGAMQIENRKNVMRRRYDGSILLRLGVQGVVSSPYLESAGFKNIEREFISKITFLSEVVYGIKP